MVKDFQNLAAGKSNTGLFHARFYLHTRDISPCVSCVSFSGHFTNFFPIVGFPILLRKLIKLIHFPYQNLVHNDNCIMISKISLPSPFHAIEMWSPVEYRDHAYPF